MSSVATFEERMQWREQQLASNDNLVTNIPKVELHVHIDGTMSPELRWKLAQKYNFQLTTGSKKIPLNSLDDTRKAYTRIRGRVGAASASSETDMTFFEAIYGGMELLKEQEDFYALALEYFTRAAKMNVRYCEVFADAQCHTRRGIDMSVIMGGFRQAQLEAESLLNIKSQWILCFLRDMSVESAMQQYEAALPYKDMIVGVGLVSDELDRPPMLFKDVYQRARDNGFKLTAHCDFNQKDTHKHILQVVHEVGGAGANRIDHGMNATDIDGLLEVIVEKGIGMTVCPCAYIRHTAPDQIFPRIRKLFDAGVKVTIASDDPTYMHDNWVLHGLLMVRDKCGFTDEEMVQLQRNAVEACWADEKLKMELMAELDEFQMLYQSSIGAS